jgi:hypothetical protein
MQDERESPKVLDYGSPSPRPSLSTKLDATAAVALTVGLFSLGPVLNHDAGGLRYHFRVTAGTWGGAVGMLLALVALGRLLLRRGKASDIALALLAFMCGAMAELGGIMLIVR